MSHRPAHGLRAYVSTRRDLCYVMGRRMNRLNLAAAACAWAHLAGFLERMGEPSSPHYLHSPKFKDLISAMRAANIRAHQSAGAINAVGILLNDGTIFRSAPDDWSI